MKLRRWVLAATAVLSGVGGHALGAEIVLEQSAVQKLVIEGLFKDNGRYYLQKGVCSAYLENPTTTLDGGRVVIRSRLSGRFGAVVGNECFGVGLASWTVVSGAPSAQGSVVRLDDIRLDDVGDPDARLLLNSGLVPSLPTVFRLDVLQSVRAMLQGTNSQIQADVQALNIEAVRAAANQLSIRFDFRLVGR
ncbi:MAG: hypothetical protein KDH15_17495 [Rhodocyclaceae bacterium]|nr:hypothetical protein [Rhodocyclaceae bacterium]